MSNKVECVCCHGTGEVPCDTCNGEGKSTCPDCDGEGKKECDICCGEGDVDAEEFCDGYLDYERDCEQIIGGGGDCPMYDEKSFAQLIKIADTGYAEACFIVACCYDGGAKATDDGRLAWLALEKNPEGLRTIVDNDLVKAEKYYRMCADNGTTTVQGDRGLLLTAAAQKCLGRMLLKEVKDDARKRDGIEWLKKAAENDCESALLWMAFISIGGVSGLDGLKTEPEKALSYFKRYLECDPWGPQTIEMVKEYIEKLPKAVNGDVSAILDLAKIHENDDAPYDESSLSNLTGGFSDLESYWLGQAAQKDYEPAIVKLEKVATGGNAEAKKKLDSILGNKYNCKTCRDKGTVTCPTCGGKKEFECSTCHGKGHLDSCSSCGSTGKVTCGNCGGTGKVGVDCPVCDHGKVTKTRLRNCEVCHGTGRKIAGKICLNCGRYILKNEAYCPYCDSPRLRTDTKKCFHCEGSGQVEEKYQEICPNCHGDYKGYKGEKSCGSCGGTGKRTCSSCNGSGKKKCEKCGGRGKVECSQCHGAGSVKCPECQKREEEAAAAKAKREADERKRREEAAAAEKRRREKAAAEERERTRASYKSHGAFVTLGLLLGGLGIHFAYIGRWFLFLVQLVLTGCGVALFFLPSATDWVQNLMMPYSVKLNELGFPYLGMVMQYPILVLAGIWCLLGILFVTKDGTNHKMHRNPLAMYILTIAIQVCLLEICSKIKLPKTMTWRIIENVAEIILFNLHFVCASLVAERRSDRTGAIGLLSINTVAMIITCGLKLFYDGDIAVVVAIAWVIYFIWVTCKMGKRLA